MDSFNRFELTNEHISGPCSMPDQVITQLFIPDSVNHYYNDKALNFSAPGFLRGITMIGPSHTGERLLTVIARGWRKPSHSVLKISAAYAGLQVSAPFATGVEISSMTHPTARVQS